jgi:serine/threonine protein kinase
LEYVDGGELQWKNEFDDPINSMDDIKSYILDLVVGVEYLHYQGKLSSVSFILQASYTEILSHKTF